MIERPKGGWKKKHESKPTASSSASEDRRDSDVNPTHREDFNSLVNAAARKRESVKA
jgi:hypothetical protein